MSTPAAVVRQVRHALTHLYDPESLRTSPLIDVLGLRAQENPQAALRDALIAVIEALKPAAEVPINSRSWRIYRLLQCRYVQQMDQEQTADQIGLSVRHLRREQRVAVHALAEAVHRKCGNGHAGAPAADGDPVAEMESELSWLRAPAQGGIADVAAIVEPVVRLAAPLATAQRAHLDAVQLPGVLKVAVHPAALRQALLSTTTYVLRRISGGWVRFAADRRGREVLLRVVGTSEGGLEPGSEDVAASLEAAGTLLSMHGGGLKKVEGAGSLSVTLALPVAAVADVLLIDDNADAAQLFDRYISGTRYRLRAVAKASEALDVLATCPVKIIVLDVMIPGIDGWEILSRLREHAQASGIPVVVCTVLPERELAAALGAAGFLRKPVTREAFLAELDRALDAEPSRPH